MSKDVRPQLRLNVFHESEAEEVTWGGWRSR
jgi:hypothetical protein